MMKNFILTLLMVSLLCVTAVLALQSNEDDKKLDALSFSDTGAYWLTALDQVYPGAWKRISGASPQEIYNSALRRARELALQQLKAQASAKSDTVKAEGKDAGK